MGLRAFYQKPCITIPFDPSERYAYLVDLRLLMLVDQVWATDITYIPLHKCFLYMVTIVHLFTRNVLSRQFSNSLDTEFCRKAWEMALEGCRKPEIFHSEQSSQFISSAFVARLQSVKIMISWTSRKRCYDNILVERLWRSAKYQEVNLPSYSDVCEAEASLVRFTCSYCHVKPHSSLGGKAPHEAYTINEPSFFSLELTSLRSTTVQ